MKRTLAILFYVFALTSCSIATPINYTPDPSKVTDPISVMKINIEQQPTSYAYMPTDIEIDEHCIKLYMSGSRPQPMPIVGSGGAGVIVGQSASEVSVQTICYKNIGTISLSHLENDKIWRVNIDDRSGNYMYWVYSFDRNDCERFIDALSIMMTKEKASR